MSPLSEVYVVPFVQGKVFHVCLAGPVITANPVLLDALRPHYDVSLVVDPSRLNTASILGCSHVLVLDASGLCVSLQLLLRSLRQRWPDLPIVLVDGGLSEHDKADAFSLGVLDYFAAPCHVDLLAERLQVLARSGANLEAT
jgi:DNA-binding response OmpR family regulator